MASASESFGSEAPSARREAQFANDQRGDGEPAGLTATYKSRAANSVSSERASEPEEDNLGSPRSRWQRALVPWSIVVLGLAVILFIKIVGAPPQWWPL